MAWWLWAEGYISALRRMKTDEVKRANDAAAAHKTLSVIPTETKLKNPKEKLC